MLWKKWWRSLRRGVMTKSKRCLDFCMGESESIRVLESWVGMKEDVNMRLRRAGGSWAKVKEQLNNTRLSKRWQARIAQAWVESALLFDCQARVWWKKNVMRLQKWMDKCWQYMYGAIEMGNPCDKCRHEVRTCMTWERDWVWRMSNRRLRREC